MSQNNHTAYKQQLMFHGVDEPTASLAAQGCVALDEGRDRTDQEQAAVDAASKVVIRSVKSGSTY